MSSLRGEGQGWTETLLQRGVEDEVESLQNFQHCQYSNIFNISNIPNDPIFQYFQPGTIMPPVTTTLASTKLSIILAI